MLREQWLSCQKDFNCVANNLYKTKVEEQAVDCASDKDRNQQLQNPHLKCHNRSWIQSSVCMCRRNRTTISKKQGHIITSVNRRICNRTWPQQNGCMRMSLGPWVILGCIIRNAAAQGTYLYFTDMTTNKYAFILFTS